jgi:hypothetical protein
VGVFHEPAEVDHQSEACVNRETCVRILTTEPAMRRFLQLDGDFTVSPAMREAAEQFLESASMAMAKALRAAGATMPVPDLGAVAELHTRLATSMARVSTNVLDTKDIDAVRRYAQQHLSQLVFDQHP